MGTVWVPSDTTLFIAADAEIVASRHYEKLVAPVAEMFNDHGKESSEGAFVRIRNARNVLVTGGGRISGSGEWYVHEPRELPSLTPFEVTMLPRRDQEKEINTVPGTVRYFYRQRRYYAYDKHYMSYFVPLSDFSTLVLRVLILFIITILFFSEMSRA